MQNFRGQESHPIDQYDFWKNSQAENEQFRQVYDSLVSNLSSAQVKSLHELIRWCRSNTALDECYNNSPDAIAMNDIAFEVKVALNCIREANYTKTTRIFREVTVKIWRFIKFGKITVEKHNIVSEEVYRQKPERRNTRTDHVVPLKTFYQILVDRKVETTEDFMKYAEKYLHLVYITKDEDDRLTKAGLRDKMPSNWSDPFDRYATVGIRVADTRIRVGA